MSQLEVFERIGLGMLVWHVAVLVIYSEIAAAFSKV